MNDNTRLRNVCFTLNNPDYVSEGELDPSLWDGCTYCIYQIESGEDGTEHYQGYFELASQKTLRQVKQFAGLERAHFERRKGTAKQATDYCQKEDSRIDGPYIWGQPSSQGKRNDLDEVKEKLKRGVTMSDIAEDHFESWVKYHKSFKEYKNLVAIKRNWAMDLIFFIGPSGSGKTRAAVELAGDSVYSKPPGPWWDNYNGEHTVLWDEFYGHSYPFTQLLQVVDRYAMQVPFKGGFHQFSSKRIIFTSNQEPKDWYNAERTHQMSWENNPLNRRITQFGRIIRTGDVHVIQEVEISPTQLVFSEETGLWNDQ